MSGRIRAARLGRSLMRSRLAPPRLTGATASSAAGTRNAGGMRRERRLSAVASLCSRTGGAFARLVAALFVCGPLARSRQTDVCAGPARQPYPQSARGAVFGSSCVRVLPGAADARRRHPGLYESQQENPGPGSVTDVLRMIRYRCPRSFSYSGQQPGATRQMLRLVISSS